MKNKILYILFVLIIFTFCGCNNDKNDNAFDTPVDITINSEMKELAHKYAYSLTESFTYQEISDYYELIVIYNKDNNCLSFSHKVENFENVIRNVKCYIQFDKDLGKYIYTNSFTKTYQISDEEYIIPLFNTLFNQSFNDYISKKIVDNVNKLDDGNDNKFQFLNYGNGFLFKNEKRYNDSNEINNISISLVFEKNNLKPIDISDYVIYPC